MAVVAAGCLQKETIHTLYISPEGGVAWVAVEANVHSDESDPGQRMAEEQSYIGPALIGSHRVALGLRALEPETLVGTTVVRGERPFHVITEARFARVDRVLERLLIEAGLPARVTLVHDGDRTRLRIQLDFSRTVVDRETPVSALLEEIEHFVFVLPEGTFIAGGGFEVPDRARARLSKEAFDAIDEAMTARRAIELTLAWNAGSSDSVEGSLSGCRSNERTA
jgi:hypothetical protein